MKQYEKVGEFLHEIGWRAPSDAQWSNLRESLPKLRELLRKTPAETLTEAQAEAVKTFAEKHGRYWKAAMKRLWGSGKDDGVFRQLRNRLGSSGLNKLKLEDL